MLYRVLVEETITNTLEIELSATSKAEVEGIIHGPNCFEAKYLGAPLIQIKIRKITNVEQEDNKNVSPA